MKIQRWGEDEKTKGILQDYTFVRCANPNPNTQPFQAKPVIHQQTLQYMPPATGLKAILKDTTCGYLLAGYRIRMGKALYEINA